MTPPLPAKSQNSQKRESRCRTLDWGACFRVDGEIPGDGPLLTDDGFGGLIELGGHVENVKLDLARLAQILGEADEGVDFEVCEMEVDVDRVETDDEIGEDVFGLCVCDVGQ